MVSSPEGRIPVSECKRRGLIIVPMNEALNSHSLEQQSMVRELVGNAEA